MKKILTIVGARPQFIKLAPVSKELRKYFKEIIVHTGQHYDKEMSKVFFDELNIPKPDYNLGIGGMDNEEQIIKMKKSLEDLFIKEKPDLVIVYGDTNSTLAGALSAKKLNIPVVHIEAGMRSYDDIPEEFNRVETDKISDYLFCTSKNSLKNLKSENIKKKIFLSGDVMFDAFIHNIKLAAKHKNLLAELGFKEKDYILATVHRAENTDDNSKLKNIFDAFIESGEKILMPLHPRTKKEILNIEYYEKIKDSNICMIKPVGYLEMLVLEKNAKKIITDSGGVQKEAYFSEVPCIILRELTEWVELNEKEQNILVGTDKKKILNAIKNFEIKNYKNNIYGEGKSAKIIAEILKNELQ